MIRIIKRLLITHKELRYIASGITSEAIEYASFIVILSITSWLIVANSVSFILGIISGFILHKKWSFAGDHKLKAQHQIMSYFILGATNFAAMNVLVWFAVYALHIHPYLAKIIAMGIIAAWSYFVFNKLIFKEVR